MSKQKGFTLIELLVVIAIIAILAAVVLVALGNARNQAQDSTRKSDSNALMTAVELYKNNNSGTPPATGGETAALVPTYLAVIPPNVTYSASGLHYRTCTALIATTGFGFFKCEDGSCADAVACAAFP